jgi:hypothetical protein
MKDRTTISMLKYKAESLLTSREYSAYVEDVLKDLRIYDAKDAFILGAVDAMINGATHVMDDTGALKKSLLETITHH